MTSSEILTIRKKLLSLFNACGVPYELNDKAPPAWDGKVAHLRRIPVEFWSHELAHYLVASKSRRKEPNFGLGPDPDADREEQVTSELLTERQRVAEEAEAAYLGVIILKYFDFPSSIIEYYQRETAVTLSWASSADWATVIRLHKKRVLPFQWSVHQSINTALDNIDEIVECSYCSNLVNQPTDKHEKTECSKCGAKAIALVSNDWGGESSNGKLKWVWRKPE